ncbi:MAG: DUF364 domain-containing protein [Desulfobacteraceae bacterium]|jgi:uncharacterized protein (DUF4213/DUF364 family)|nr:DUF364 domain-containing protein [Desulfobacteraceae bacterium]
MRLNQKLYDLFKKRAGEVNINVLCLGLGYTAVTLSDGGIGLSYTHFEDKKSCMLLNKHIDYEEKPAIQLLEKIKSDHPVERSMALALVNALNHKDALGYPEDRKNSIMLDRFKIGQGTNVAMVGFIGPLVDILKQKNALVEVLDASRNMGQKEDFYTKLGNWADVLLLTSTSILNNTTEEILRKVHPKVKTVMLGPSTPMVAAAFEHLPVHMLAGTVPVDKANVLKAIRHGMGTPVLQKFSRKSYLSL